MIRQASVSVDLNSENTPAGTLEYRLFKYEWTGSKRDKKFFTLKDILELGSLIFQITAESDSDDDSGSDCLYFLPSDSPICFRENGKTVSFWWENKREGIIFCENFRDSFDSAEWTTYEQDYEY